MKKSIYCIAVLLVLISCSSTPKNEAKVTNQQNTNTEVLVTESVNNNLVKEYLTDTKSFAETTLKQPIVEFKYEADAMKTFKLDFNKNNFKDVIAKADDYKTVVIIVGDHTIVKVEDFNNCSESGSWGACMPYGEGYIKKGDLQFEKGFINYIIGIPDNQIRTAYFFNQ